MELKEIIAQIFGLIGMAVAILSYQGKAKKTVILMQLVSTFMFTVNFALLGATIGALLNGIGFIRAIIFVNKDKFHTERIGWLIGFIVVFALMYPATFLLFDREPTLKNLVLELLPVIGMCAGTVGYYLKDAAHVRKLALIGSPCWLIYNVFTGSIGAVLCEVFSLISVIIGMIRHDRKGGKAA